MQHCDLPFSRYLVLGGQNFRFWRSLVIQLPKGEKTIRDRQAYVPSCKFSRRPRYLSPGQKYIVFLIYVPSFMSLLVFHCNYVCISYRFWDIQHQRNLETGDMGRSRSLKMSPFDWWLVGHCKYSSVLYHFRVIWRSIIVTLKKVTAGHSN